MSTLSEQFLDLIKLMANEFEKKDIEIRSLHDKAHRYDLIRDALYDIKEFCTEGEGQNVAAFCVKLLHELRDRRANAGYVEGAVSVKIEHVKDEQQAEAVTVEMLRWFHRLPESCAGGLRLVACPCGDEIQSNPYPPPGINDDWIRSHFPHRQGYYGVQMPEGYVKPVAPIAGTFRVRITDMYGGNRWYGFGQIFEVMPVTEMYYQVELGEHKGWFILKSDCQIVTESEPEPDCECGHRLIDHEFGNGECYGVRGGCPCTRYTPQAKAESCPCGLSQKECADYCGGSRRCKHIEFQGWESPSEAIHPSDFVKADHQLHADAFHAPQSAETKPVPSGFAFLPVRFDEKLHVVLDRIGQLICRPFTDTGDSIAAAINAYQPPADEREQGTKCQRCLKRYTVDVLIPDELWRRISHGINRMCSPCIFTLVEHLSGFDAFNLSESLCQPPVEAPTANAWKEGMVHQDRLDATRDFARIENVEAPTKLDSDIENLSEKFWKDAPPIRHESYCGAYHETGPCQRSSGDNTRQDEMMSNDVDQMAFPLCGCGCGTPVKAYIGAFLDNKFWHWAHLSVDQFAKAKQEKLNEK